MKASLVCVCFRRDLEYARYLLLSVERFVTGFNEFVFDVPTPDVDLFRELALEFIESIRPTRLRITSSEEWPGKGMLFHEARVVLGDVITDAEIICHIDADCVFTAPVTPETYAPGGKPILRWESYESIMARRPDHAQWCDVTRRNLTFKQIVDTMKCHPNTYHRSTYGLARILIKQKTGLEAEEYIKTCQNEFPQGFCEYVTLGNVALHGPPNLYIPVQQDGKSLNPDNHVAQCWSHSPPHIPQDIYVKGGMRRCAPMEIFREIGIT